MDKLLHQVADLLLAIEQEMRRVGLWETTPPPAAALQSLVPFCYDTLRFEQWLQWVFMVKMKQALEQQIDFPTTSNIAALAELRFPELSPLDTQRLQQLLREFDEAINAASR
ncbi:MAG TPA: YqcC family protein [Gammaproteobacteria bacterium]